MLTPRAAKMARLREQSRPRQPRSLNDRINRPDTRPHPTKLSEVLSTLATREPSTQDIRNDESLPRRTRAGLIAEPDGSTLAICSLSPSESQCGRRAFACWLTPCRRIRPRWKRTSQTSAQGGRRMTPPYAAAIETLRNGVTAAMARSTYSTFSPTGAT